MMATTAGGALSSPLKKTVRVVFDAAGAIENAVSRGCRDFINGLLGLQRELLDGGDGFSVWVMMTRRMAVAGCCRTAKSRCRRLNPASVNAAARKAGTMLS